MMEIPPLRKIIKDAIKKIDKIIECDHYNYVIFD